MIIDEEVYLEHYGVKGMKWGVRNDKRRAAKLKKYGPRDKKKRTASQKRARTVRNIDRTNKTLAMAAAGIFIAGLISDMNRPKTDYSRRDYDFNFKDYSRPSPSVKDLIERERKVKIDAIEKTWREGFMDDAQRKQFTDAMNKRYDRKIADALKNN